MHLIRMFILMTIPAMISYADMMIFDFEHGFNKNNYGGWTAYDDRYDNGTSKILSHCSDNGQKAYNLDTLSSDGYESDSCALLHYSLGVNENSNISYVGLAMSFFDTVDFSGTKAVKFNIRADRDIRVWFRIQTSDITDYNYYAYTVNVNKKWQTISIDLRLLRQMFGGIGHEPKPFDTTKVIALSWEINADANYRQPDSLKRYIDDGKLYIDNVELIGNPASFNQVHDFSLESILSPDEEEEFMETSKPQIVIKNEGKETDSCNVYLKIGTSYSDSLFVSLTPSQLDTLVFKSWNPLSAGSYALRCSTGLSSDLFKSNNTIGMNVTVKGMEDEPVISKITPEKVGNKGVSTIQIEGKRFKKGLKIKLVNSKKDTITVDSNFIGINSDGKSLKAFLYLDNAGLGSYDVHVINNEKSYSVYHDGITIENYKTDVNIDVIGKNQIRVGKSASFDIFITNNSNHNISYPFLLIGCKGGGSLSKIYINGGDTIWKDTIDNKYLGKVTQKSTFPDFTYRGVFITKSFSPGQNAIITATFDGKYLDINNSAVDIKMPVLPDVYTNRPEPIEILHPPVGTLPQDIPIQTGVPQYLIQFTERLMIAKAMELYSETIPLDYEKFIDIIMDAIKDAIQSMIKDGVDCTLKYFLGKVTASIENANLPQADDFIDWLRDVNDKIEEALENYNDFSETNDLLEQNVLKIKLPDLQDPDKITNIIESILRILIVQSVDPNEMVGPSGYGPDNFTKLNTTYDYSIYFENVDSATASAEEIYITDTLDKNLDWSTLTYKNSSHPVTSIDFDTVKGIIKWSFIGIDLPPNKKPPEGEGWVSYSINPKKMLTTGTRIRSRAHIVFDVNKPLATAEFVNTIDAGRPSSSVNSLKKDQPLSDFKVNWGGTDDNNGSGIKTYSIYYSDNNSAYTLWKQTDSTSAVFKGVNGHKYRFYSVATDNTGNVEIAPESFDATTTVAVPSEIKVSPNPFKASKGHTVISFFGTGVPGAKLKIYNKANLLVATIEEKDGNEQLDWNGKSSDGRTLASGVYVFVAKLKSGDTQKGKFSIIR